LKTISRGDILAKHPLTLHDCGEDMMTAASEPIDLILALFQTISSFCDTGRFLCQGSATGAANAAMGFILLF